MPSARWSLTCLALAVTTLLGAATVAQVAGGKSWYILATGRRLPYLYVISLDAALNPGNDRTSNAIVGRSKVAAEALAGSPWTRAVCDIHNNQTCRSSGHVGIVSIDIHVHCHSGNADERQRHGIEILHGTR